MQGTLICYDDYDFIICGIEQLVHTGFLFAADGERLSP